jgi:ubiquinol-cytochrome c reductase cytochrome c1 subunit
MKTIGLRFSLGWLLLSWIITAFAATPIHLSPAPITPNDTASIKRGAVFFAGHCMVCHSLKYLQDDRIANGAGITAQTMPGPARQLALTIPPPDLSLIARIRGVNWLYTYLHSFYQDPTNTLGSNNVLVNNVNMPNPFFGLQGVQVLTVDKKELFDNGGISPKPYWFNVLKLEKQGSMTPEEFDTTVADVVTFLDYASDPQRVHRERLGRWVLGFLLIFALLAYLLKREYWKKIK